MMNKLFFRLGVCSSETDFQSIADLINTCSIKDDIKDRVSAKEMQEHYAFPQFDLAHDLRLWRDNNDLLVAIAEFWYSPLQTNETHQVQGGLIFEIHPQVRNQGLESKIVAWAEQRLREVGQGISLPLVLDSRCQDKVIERREILVQFGFVPERYFLDLKRSLHEPIPEYTIPVGWKIRKVDPKNDGAAWVEMFNQSFVDFWEHSPLTLENFNYDTSLSNYDRDLDFVIETETGKLVTFCAMNINVENNRHSGKKEGEVCLVGTRRGYRRRGSARSLLLFGLERLQSMGMEIATIGGVDSQNPSGALTLYKSVGFTEDSRKTTYRKKLLADYSKHGA